MWSDVSALSRAWTAHAATRSGWHRAAVEEIFGGGVRQLAHAQVVDDEERDGGEFREVGLAGAVEGRLGDLLHFAAAAFAR